MGDLVPEKSHKFQFDKSTRELAERLIKNYLSAHIGKITLAVSLMLKSFKSTLLVGLLQDENNDVVRAMSIIMLKVILRFIFKFSNVQVEKSKYKWNN